MSSVLESLGIDSETYSQATGEVAKAFEPFEDGIYESVVTNVILFNNSFGDTTMQYFIEADIKGERREFKFKTDISSKVKEKKTGNLIPNKGYANRFKQFAYATGVQDKNVTFVPYAKGYDSYNKHYDAVELPEFKNKKLLAVLRTYNDINKSENEKYKYMTHITGVLAPNGTDITGESQIESIKELCAKGPIEYKGYVKPSGKSGAAATSSGANMSKPDPDTAQQINALNI